MKVQQADGMSVQRAAVAAAVATADGRCWWPASAAAQGAHGTVRGYSAARFAGTHLQIGAPSQQAARRPWLPVPAWRHKLRKRWVDIAAYAIRPVVRHEREEAASALLAGQCVDKHSVEPITLAKQHSLGQCASERSPPHPKPSLLVASAVGAPSSASCQHAGLRSAVPAGASPAIAIMPPVWAGPGAAAATVHRPSTWQQQKSAGAPQATGRVRAPEVGSAAVWGCFRSASTEHCQRWHMPSSCR